MIRTLVVPVPWVAIEFFASKAGPEWPGMSSFGHGQDFFDR